MQRAGAMHPARDCSATFREYPPRQKAASFTIEQALAKLSQTSGD
jgi:hypothetical protein